MMKGTAARRRGRLTAVALATGLVLAACGSDEDNAADTTTTAAAVATTAEAPATTEAASATTEAASATTEAAPETTGAAAEKSPVLIAATIDVSGPSPVSPDTIKVLESWRDYINAKGGLNGHPVEFDIRDVKGDAALAQSLTQELLAKKPIMFLLDTPSTETAQSEALAQSGVPVMGAGYNPSVWGGYIAAFQLTCSTDAGAPLACGIPNAFPVTTGFGAVVDEQLYGAQAAGATKLATAACAEVDSCSAAAPVFNATAQALGLEDTGVVKVSSTATDFSAECIQWIQQGVDFIQLSGSSTMGANLIASCKDQGYEGIFGASAGSVRGDLIKIDDITLAGGLHAFPWWVDDAPVQEYREAMEAGGVSEDGWHDPTSTGLWSALQLFAKAQANLSDDPTAEEALNNMYTIKDETLDGLIAPVTYTADNPDRSRHCFWPYILKDGEFSAPLGGLNYQCNPPEA